VDLAAAYLWQGYQVEEKQILMASSTWLEGMRLLSGRNYPMMVLNPEKLIQVIGV